jgi:antitoxin component of MazEF toxin-antitoxin module
MDVIPIQVVQQEVIIPLTYFPESSELELEIKGDVVVIRPSKAAPRLHQHEQQNEMLAQTAVFEARLEELQQTHLGEYVAFYQGELIDHDSDHRQLVQRIKARYPQEIVLIRQVTAQPPVPLRLGSPRFVC